MQLKHGMRHLGTSIRSRFCRPFIHVSHSSSLSAGRGSFHPIFPWHIVCIILFPVSMKAERNPDGSNIDATMESIMRRVGDVLWPTTLKQNTSSPTFHLIPSACSIGNRSVERSRKHNLSRSCCWKQIYVDAVHHWHA